MDHQHIVEVPAYFFILRVAQIVVSVFVLALSAASIGLLHGYYYLGGTGYTIFVVCTVILRLTSLDWTAGLTCLL